MQVPSPHLHKPPFPSGPTCLQGLRYVFQTDSKYTLAVSGTGHAGMEAVIANLLEPGETIVVGNSGIWGTRVCDMAERFGAKVSAWSGSGDFEFISSGSFNIPSAWAPGVGGWEGAISKCVESGALQG